MYVVEFPVLSGESLYLCWDNQASEYILLYSPEDAFVFPTEEKAKEALDFMTSHGDVVPSNWHIIKADDVKRN